jgi:hypothetical protein
VGKTKVEIITERRSLPIRPGILRGSSDQIDVDVCTMCGAIVFDGVQHYIWHTTKLVTR